MKKIAVYPGTFDPFTHGHVDILQRAATLFDTVIVAIAESNHKNPMFSVAQRLEIAQNMFSGMQGVEVFSFSGLLVDFMVEKQAHIIVRGIRTMSDMEYEFQLAAAHRYIYPAHVKTLETIFLQAKAKYAHISGTIVREIARMGGGLSAFVPPAVIAALDTHKRETYGTEDHR